MSTRNLTRAALAAVALALPALAQETPPPKADGVVVDTSIPGGNGIVEKVEGDTVLLRQDLRDTAGDWFYWHVRVRGAAGRTLTFKFTKGNVLGVRGPAVSADGGKTWSWLGAAACQGASFRYAFPAGADDVRLSFTLPYFESHLKGFLAKHATSAALRPRPSAGRGRGATWSCCASGGSGASPTTASSSPRATTAASRWRAT